MSQVSIGPKAVRKMALEMLDEPDGIKKSVYETLSIMLVQSKNEDIMEQVDVTETRAYIGETYSEEELAKIKDEETPETSEKSDD